MDAGQDVTELSKQLDAAGTRLEQVVEENEDLQIKLKEAELETATLQEVQHLLLTMCLSCLDVVSYISSSSSCWLCSPHLLSLDDDLAMRV